MALRTSKSVVTFKGPFSLPELEGLLPAGDYRIETDEEIIEGLERTAYVRRATLLYVESGSTTQVVTIDPQGIEAALASDREPSIVQASDLPGPPEGSGRRSRLGVFKLVLAGILLAILPFVWRYGHMPLFLAICSAAALVIWGLNLDWKRKAAVAAENRTSVPRERA